MSGAKIFQAITWSAIIREIIDQDEFVHRKQGTSSILAAVGVGQSSLGVRTKVLFFVPKCLDLTVRADGRDTVSGSVREYT